MSKNAQKIGWLGTGRMGLPMAVRLLRAGHDVRIWSRTRAQAGPQQSSVPWVLREGHHEARAELRIIDGIGDELRFLWNGEMRVTRLTRIGEGAQLLDASERNAASLKREAGKWSPLPPR